MAKERRRGRRGSGPLRVGLVGAGVIGNVHRAVYEQLPETEVVALADPRGVAVLSQGGAAYVPGSGVVSSINVPIYATLTEMLAAEQLDIVDICSPTPLHRDQAVEALIAGKNVLCEKPMARTTAECDEMVAAAKMNDRRFMIAHCLRFWPMYEYVRDLIDSGEYGRVERARFSRTVSAPEGGWFLQGERSGGAILDLHIHDVDATQWIFGVPRSLTAFGRIGPSGRHDQVVAVWHYPDDRLVTLEGTWLRSAREPFCMTFELALEAATVTYDSTRPNGLQLHVPGRPPLAPELSARDGYYYEIEYFVTCILEGRPIERAAPESARTSVALVEHEIHSIVSGTTVEVKAT